MIRQPTLGIGMVEVVVPIDVPPLRRTASGGAYIKLEIWGFGIRVWDGVTSTMCGDFHSFGERENHPGALGRDDLPKVPHFDQVYRYVVDQYAANRGNPLGRFLEAAVKAMDQALCERDGTSVYFAQAGSRIKIGWSRNVAARIGQLQTGNAEPVRLLATSPGARSLERQLHERFADARVAGEWFEATPELVAYINDLAVGRAA